MAEKPSPGCLSWLEWLLDEEEFNPGQTVWAATLPFTNP